MTAIAAITNRLGGEPYVTRFGHGRAASLTDVTVGTYGLGGDDRLLPGEPADGLRGVEDAAPREDQAVRRDADLRADGGRLVWSAMKRTTNLLATVAAAVPCT